MEQYKQEFIEFMVESDVLKFGEFTLKSGRKSPFFMNAGVLCLIAGLVILAYLPWTLFLKSKKQYLSNPAFKEPLHYRMTDQGIEVSQKGETQGQKWEDMYKAVSTPRSIILYTSRVNASIFPKKDLGEKSSAVIRMISTHMPPRKVKIRS